MEPFRELCKLAGRAVGEYRMIDEGDRILVGLSGGKDSFALLHVLHHLRRHAPISFSVIAATFDPGFPGFRADAVAAYCRERRWEHRIVQLPVAEILREKQFENSPCVLCSRLRRGKLYGLAARLGCGKLALGQHLDDAAVSFLMSLCRGQGLTTMGPNVLAKSDGAIRIIRPLIFAPEELIRRAAAGLDLPTAGECAYRSTLESGDRAYFRALLDQLSERIPDLRSQLLRSLSNLQPAHLLDPAYLHLEDSSAKGTD
ncbi:ATP-binding protein [Victivallis sp.]|uniref:ATP-binding protein n=1 Tax=Victivallis sp. TaxID=2049020 RepID=UPI003A92C2CE